MKRTRFELGIVRLEHDPGATHSLGGIRAPAAGEDQDAFAISRRHTF